jgi:hypothetical protein
MILHDYTISALGHLAHSTQRDTASLPREAVDSAGRLLDAHGNSFKARVPLKGFGHIELRWKSDDLSCALASFSLDEEMLSTDAVLSGLRPEADRKVQQAAHAMVQELCQGGGEQASDGLLRANERPAVACIRWSTKERKGMDVVRDLEICLAAAFLERAFGSVKYLV